MTLILRTLAKSAFIALAPTLIVLPSLAQNKKASELKTDEDKLSYTLGRQIGEQLTRHLQLSGLKLNKAVFFRAIEESLAGTPPQISLAESQKIMEKANDDLRNNLNKIGEKNLKDGEAFLADNKKKPGVISLSSGLQYKVLKEGKGVKPKAADSVTVKYEGRLIDGKVFDSSDKQSGPVTFPVDGVIKGWTEALQLMSTGSVWEVYIPSQLAYGPRGQLPDIGPNATLIFKVELLSVTKSKAPEPAKKEENSTPKK